MWNTWVSPPCLSNCPQSPSFLLLKRFFGVYPVTTLCIHPASGGFKFSPHLFVVVRAQAVFTWKLLPSVWMVSALLRPFSW